MTHTGNSGIRRFQDCGSTDASIKMESWLRLNLVCLGFGMGKNKKLTKAIFLITTILMCIYLGWRTIFTLPFSDGIFPLVFGVLLLLSEMASAFSTFELFWRKSKELNFHLELPSIPASWFPDIDVFIATHNESVDLLYKTVNACTFMDYPDKSKVHIYLCDDGDRPAVADLVREFGVGYLGLAGNKHAKSGNLNNALSKTDSPLVVTFDADMIPRSSFLLKTVPYFFLPILKKTQDGSWVRREHAEIDPKYRIGFIQTPQSFYNPDLFQFNLYAEKTIPNEQDFFTKEINVMRNSSNAPAYTGSNTVILRDALDQIGGFPTDTITEDFETGIKIQALGYTTYATSEILASGLAPTSVKSMISQRVRWARGVIQSIRNCRVPFNKGLSPAARVSYMVSHSYWWSFARRFIFILAPIMFALFDVRVAVCGFWDLLAFWAPSHLFYSIAMRSLSSDIRSQRWCQIIDTILAPYLLIPVILETLGIKMRKFKVTNKSNEEHKRKFTFLYAIPHLILLGLSAAALIRFTGDKYGMALLFSSIILFWLAYNVINLVYAVFFMAGRKIQRKHERFDASESLIVSYDARILHAVTENISEGGLAFVLDRAEYIPDHMPIDFTMYSERYRSSFRGHIIYVRHIQGKWYYYVSISAMDDGDRRQYLQLVYDRIHSLPQKLNAWMTAFDDIARNMNTRVEKSWSEKRALPRIRLDMPVRFRGGATGLLVDFNYWYIMMKDFDPGREKLLQYIFAPEPGIRLVLEPVEKRVKNDPERKLFRVVNWRELVYDPLFAGWLDRQLSGDGQKSQPGKRQNELERIGA